MRLIHTGMVLAAVAVVIATSAAAKEYPTISYREAEDHVGEIVWVEGTILKTQKKPEGTYLYFNNDPDKYIRVIIPKKYLGNFEGDPKYLYTGKKVKAIGKVDQLGHRLILGVSEPKRIREVEPES